MVTMLLQSTLLLYCIRYINVNKNDMCVKQENTVFPISRMHVTDRIKLRQGTAPKTRRTYFSRTTLISSYLAAQCDYGIHDTYLRDDRKLGLKKCSHFWAFGDECCHPASLHEGDKGKYSCQWVWIIALCHDFYTNRLRDLVCCCCRCCQTLANFLGWYVPAASAVGIYPSNHC